METDARRSGGSWFAYAEDRRYVLGVLGRRWRLDRGQLEDIFHDACLVMLEKVEAGVLDGEMPRAQARAYLTQTALNKALEWGRRARRSVLLDGGCEELCSAGPGIEERVIVREEARRVGEAVGSLPERRQEVLKLRYYLGFEPEEIQRRLGVSRDVYRHELERGTRAVSAAVAA